MKQIPVSAAIARQSRSNFYSSFLFLPIKQRRAMTVLYALSRLIDDSVDEERDRTRAKEEIAQWRERVRNIYQGKNHFAHPILAEVKEVVSEFGLREKYLLDLITGMELDLEKKEYQNFHELEKYCYYAAGTIGLLCNQIFGFHDSRAERYAILLGTAFQLTNIIRDVGIDAEKGRIYLPQEDLREFHYSKQDLLAKKMGNNFQNLMEFQAKRAVDYFERAKECLSPQERRRLVAAHVMSQVYFRLLQRIRQQKFPVFEKKVSVPKWELLKILASTKLRYR